MTLLALSVLFVAYVNGANDNFKGVATLFGSGTSGYRGALAWGTVATFAGSLAALVLSEALVHRFSGRGLVPDALVGEPAFAGAVAAGAASAVLLATMLSLPVSTTHALAGALLGAGLARAGGDVRVGVLGGAFLLPLVASPVAALLLTAVVYPIAHRARVRAGLRRESCVCVGTTWVPAGSEAAANVEVTTCRERYSGTILSVTAQDVLNGAHYLSAGAVSFARGLNDTPKIVALLVAARAMDLRHGLLMVGLAMALGAVLQARRVAETMSRNITPMNHGQGFSANIVTAVLVLLASRFGLPVSTTHVSCGALFGIGAVTGQARWKTVGAILLAWVVTLPTAALLGAGVAACTGP